MKWISVSDETPLEPGMYLCHWSDGTTETFPADEEDFDNNGDMILPWGMTGRTTDYVTHWMPLPESPE